MTVKKRKLIVLTVAICLVLALVIWIAWGNTALELNTYSLSCESLPNAFDGFRIAHVSDLHNAQMGEGNADLLQILQDSNPDIIAITGDLIDSRNTDLQVAIAFVQEAVKIAPCYYVTGNHEARIEEYPSLRSAMEEAGVIVLEDEKTQIQFNGETITIIGVNDPIFTPGYQSELAEILMTESLAKLHSPQEDGFTILLSHRPRLFDVYVQSGIDLVLSGHAHGGQFRLPFVGGVYVPSQGLFPKYDAGLFTKGNTNMIVSRGIGNSAFPFRINNRPEVILIELHAC
ncbi:MAG: metallophosphoesterase [Oscillospiraceae bacterium]|nr:metallophosphoesterase [Oscillospiraceae bacterium]